jgi:hypothetical protein
MAASAADFVDKSILSDLESEGFFSRLSAKYGVKSACRDFAAGFAPECINAQ